MVAHQAGRSAEADDFYRRAVEENPADARALRLRGSLAREAGDLESSCRFLERAAAIASADAAPLSELALTAIAADDLDAAVRWLRRGLERDPGHARTLANLGALLQYRGHVLESIGCHERALALTPRDIEVRCNLAKALAEVGRANEALNMCEAGLAHAPANPRLLAVRGAVLCDAECFGDAVVALEGATARSPDDDTAWVNLAFARTRLGEPVAAIDALHAALRANPANGRATADLVNLLAGTGHSAEALGRARRFLAVQPGERQVLAALGFALRDAGDVNAAEALLDYERLLCVIDTSEATTAQLAMLITADASRLRSPASKATRGGAQTGELELAAEPEFAELESMLGRAVRDTAARIEDIGLGAHPAMAGASSDWTIRAWGTLLTSGGRQLPHIHPAGWLSGVYYVGVPADMRVADPQGGSLEFGAPPDRYLVREVPRLVAVSPRPGRLVLFPSYFHHRTLPFSGEGVRISIAFDVVPKRVGKGTRTEVR